MKYLLITTRDGIEFKFIYTNSELWMSVEDIVAIKQTTGMSVRQQLNNAMKEFIRESEQHEIYAEVVKPDGRVYTVKHYSIHVIFCVILRGKLGFNPVEEAFRRFYSLLLRIGFQYEKLNLDELPVTRLPISRKWQATSPRQIRLNQLPNQFTKHDWEICLAWFKYCCAVCGREFALFEGSYTAAKDHWIPITYEGDDNPGTVPENIVPLCHGQGGCNNSKQSLMPDVWLYKHYSLEEAQAILDRIEIYFAWVRNNPDKKLIEWV